ncbi:hypothetical protein C8Q74DRAFT_438553 [Fomes fomentarius]|nr:hypothetical protein C8Q74DRAFT_438553 [Fomes fomentarius]
MDGPAQWGAGAHRKSGRNADCHVLSSCLPDDDTDNVALKQQRREHLISGKTKCESDTRSTTGVFVSLCALMALAGDTLDSGKLNWCMAAPAGPGSIASGHGVTSASERHDPGILVLEGGVGHLTVRALLLVGRAQQAEGNSAREAAPDAVCVLRSHLARTSRKSMQGDVRLRRHAHAKKRGLVGQGLPQDPGRMRRLRAPSSGQECGLACRDAAGRYGHSNGHVRLCVTYRLVNAAARQQVSKRVV